MTETIVFEFVTELLVQFPNLAAFVALAYILYRQNMRLIEMLNQCYDRAEKIRISDDDEKPKTPVD